VQFSENLAEQHQCVPNAVVVRYLDKCILPYSFLLAVPLSLLLKQVFL